MNSDLVIYLETEPTDEANDYCRPTQTVVVEPWDNQGWDGDPG